MLAFSSVVVVNAEREFAKGTETFPFTFTPAWDKNECIRYNTLNVEILREYFESGEIKALIIDEDSFGISFPGFVPTKPEVNTEIWNIIRENYDLAKTIPHFGSERKDLFFYLHKKIIINN